MEEIAIEICEVVDGLGNCYTAVHWEKQAVFQPLAGPKRRLPGSTHWMTRCGIDLNENSDGSFEMIQRDGTLRRI
jgi:hypothetical protein